MRVAIEGEINDNHQVKKYEFYYGNNTKPVVSGENAMAGHLGIWDVTDLEEKADPLTLKLKVTDLVGNKSCHTVNFTLDNVAQIEELTVTPQVFSPNGDGVLDEVGILYEIAEYVSVDIKVFKLVRKENGSYVLDAESLEYSGK